MSQQETASNIAKYTSEKVVINDEKLKPTYIHIKQNYY